MPQSRRVRASKRTKRRVSGPLSHPDPESRLGPDLRQGRRVEQQACRFPVGPLAGRLVRGLAEQLGVIVSQPGEQHTARQRSSRHSSASVPGGSGPSSSAS